jgi:hypothetical protein
MQQEMMLCRDSFSLHWIQVSHLHKGGSFLPKQSKAEGVYPRYVFTSRRRDRARTFVHLQVITTYENHGSFINFLAIVSNVFDMKVYENILFYGARNRLPKMR